MTDRSLGPRLLAATLAALLFVGAAVAISRTRTGTSQDGAPIASGSPTPSPSAPGEPDAPGRSPSSPGPSGPDTDEALALLASVEAAAAVPAADLLAAGLVAAQGPWRRHTDVAAWPVQRERPVYVAEATLEDRRRVHADVVVAHRLPDGTDEVVLRLLPAAEALAANGLEVEVTVGGAPVAATTEPGGLLVVPLPERGEQGEPIAIRVRLAYDLLTTAEVDATGGPAAFGIHGRSDGQAVLGHWLPLLTFEPEPIVAWGDLGSFPAAIWSVVLHHDADAVTGGVEEDCPDGASGAVDGATACTWAQGVSLRDLAAVVQEVAAVHTEQARGTTVRVTAGEGLLPAAVEAAAREAAVAVSGLTRRFGALAWPDVEVVAVPLGRGAAGMEFPGLILVDDDSAGALGGGFGSYVLAHEVGHQWFHALVGNGSFADPVVDESLAQYTAVLVYRDLFGPDAAAGLVERTMAARYREFQAGERPEEPPAQPAGDFASSSTYGPLVYARAALAWIAAEQVVGEAAVEAYLRGVVRDHGLGEVTAHDLIERAVGVDERFGQTLSRYWEADEPQPIP